MRHVPDQVLRRLEDEPFSVADSTAVHVARCRRCRARHQEIAASAGAVHRWLAGPQLVPDIDDAWQRFRRALPANVPASASHDAARLRLRRHRGAKVAVAGSVAGAVLVSGVAAAASFTPIFSPDLVKPLQLNRADIQAASQVLGLANGSSLGGFNSPNGSHTFSFGTLRWSSAGQAEVFPTAAKAEAASGLTLQQPSQLPAGVGQPVRYVVQPQVNATFNLNATAGKLAGSTITMQLGPAVGVAYASSAASAEVPTLAIATMARPTADSSKATLGQVESFLLSMPGIPSQLREEIRFLGDGPGVLPIPAPPGTTSHSVKVGRWPGVAVVAGSTASALVWEDGSGDVHAVAGLVSEQSVLHVADQLAN